MFKIIDIYTSTLTSVHIFVHLTSKILKGLLSLLQVLKLEAMDKTRHWQIVGCSAYTGEGLLEGFDWLVQDVASRIYVLD